MSKHSEYKKVLTFFTASALFSSFSNAILPVHFLDSGVTLLGLAISHLLPWIFHPLLLFIFRKFSAKKAMIFAIAISMVQILLIIHITNIWQFYLSSALFVVYVHFFFTPYNTIHFRNTEHENNGFSSGIMFTIWSVIAFFTPILAGLVAEYNIAYLWFISILLFCVTLWKIQPLQDTYISYKLSDSWQELKSLRTIIILQGFAETTFRSLIPIYTLHFIDTALGFGGFMSFIGLVGGIGNIIFARFTDKIQSRSIFLYPMSIILGICTILYPFASNDFRIWFFFAGMISLVSPIFNTLCLALMTDRKLQLMIAVPGRELALSLGRIMGGICVVLSFMYEPTLRYIFYVLGCATFMIPVVLFTKSQLLKSQSYL